MHTPFDTLRVIGARDSNQNAPKAGVIAVAEGTRQTELRAVTNAAQKISKAHKSCAKQGVHAGFQAPEPTWGRHVGVTKSFCTAAKLSGSRNLSHIQRKWRSHVAQSRCQPRLLPNWAIASRRPLKASGC